MSHKISRTWNSSKLAKKKPTHLEITGKVLTDIPASLGELPLIEFVVHESTLPPLEDLLDVLCGIPSLKRVIFTCCWFAKTAPAEPRTWATTEGTAVALKLTECGSLEDPQEPDIGFDALKKHVMLQGSGRFRIGVEIGYPGEHHYWSDHTWKVLGELGNDFAGEERLRAFGYAVLTSKRGEKPALELDEETLLRAKDWSNNAIRKAAWSEIDRIKAPQGISPVQVPRPLEAAERTFALLCSAEAQSVRQGLALAAAAGPTPVTTAGLLALHYLHPEPGIRKEAQAALVAEPGPLARQVAEETRRIRRVQDLKKRRVFFQDYIDAGVDGRLLGRAMFRVWNAHRSGAFQVSARGLGNEVDIYLPLLHDDNATLVFEALSEEAAVSIAVRPDRSLPPRLELLAACAHLTIVGALGHGPWLTSLSKMPRLRRLTLSRKPSRAVAEALEALPLETLELFAR